MKNSYSRRDFLRASAIGSVGLKAGLLGLGTTRVAQAQVPAPTTPVADTPVIRLGIIGTGARAARHISALQAVPGFRIVAAADVDKDRLARGVALSGENVTAYSDYQKLLANPEVDAVLIATPNLFHKEQIIAAAQAGKHVLSEKPLATSHQESVELQELSEASPQIIQYGLQLRYSSRFAELKRLVQSGRVGTPKYMHVAEFRGDWNNKNVWLYTDPKTGQKINWRYSQKASGGTLNEKCCHYFDILNWLADDVPRTVFCHGGNSVYPDRETWDNASLTLQYANDLQATFGLCMFGPNRLDLQVIGTEGSLSIETEEDSILWHPRNNRNGEKLPIPTEIGHGQGGRGIETAVLRLYEDFRDNIHAGRQPRFDTRAAVNASKVAFLGELSHAEKTTVAWEQL